MSDENPTAGPLNTQMLWPLVRSFQNAGLPEVSRCLALNALQPTLCAAKPATHIHKAEFYLRCHQRGEPGSMLEAAIVRLVLCALQLQSTRSEKHEEATVCPNNHRES
ncbi:MAG: hypothetical protein ACLQAT_20090 [Candidatus Binataceae bacterium]